MKDWDFLFDEPDQQRLQGDFATLNPPVFYELRRGEYKYISGSPATAKATIKDIAQAMWAFVGFPGEAKDKLREVPRSRHLLNGAYREVFPSGVEAERLRLPWLVYEKVQEQWQLYSDSTEKKGDEREHGRLHILWLIGRSIVRSQGVLRYQELPIGKVRLITETLDEWFQDHHKIAVDTITYVVEVKQEVAAESGRSLSPRQLFRSSDNYEAFTQRHDRLIQDVLPGNGLAVA